MSNWGEAHKDETAKRIRQFWEQNESLKNSEFQPCPQLVNSSMQVGLFVGLTMGITHRLKEMTTTPDSIAKLIPVDESQRDRFPTLSRSFGRILLSGIKGSATAAIFSASYCTLQAYNINFETSISTAGFIAAASAGSFCNWRNLFLIIIRL